MATISKAELQGFQEWLKSEHGKAFHQRFAEEEKQFAQERKAAQAESAKAVGKSNK